MAEDIQANTAYTLKIGIAWWWIFLVSSIAATYTWLAFYRRWVEKSYLKGDRNTREVK